MKFFSAKAFVRHRKTRGEIDSVALWADYEKHLETIWHRLSPAWQELAKADFHDTRILSFKQPSKTECVMRLEHATLSFSGVRFVWVPAAAVGDCWDYWELTLPDDGGVNLEIALAKDEIKIVADHVTIQSDHHLVTDPNVT